MTIGNHGSGHDCPRWKKVVICFVAILIFSPILYKLITSTPDANKNEQALTLNHDYHEQVSKLFSFKRPTRHRGSTIEARFTSCTTGKFYVFSTLSMNRAEVKQTISSELVNCGIKLTHAHIISNVLCDQHFSDHIVYTANRIGCVGDALGNVKKK